MSITRILPGRTTCWLGVTAMVVGLGFLAGCASWAGGIPGAGDPQTEVSQNLDHGLAAHGYDVVAYFPEGGREATPGSADITATWQGGEYRFVSVEHRQLFEERPEKYAPAFNGYCAYAVADDELVDIDPESYRIQDGRLLLFYKDFFVDTRKRWAHDPDGLLERADGHWAKRIDAAKASQSTAETRPATQPG
ncbi:MAG: YHS domain-containing (seleno)protein [Planctomycetota bacterium]